MKGYRITCLVLAMWVSLSLAVPVLAQEESTFVPTPVTPSQLREAMEEGLASDEGDRSEESAGSEAEDDASQDDPGEDDDASSHYMVFTAIAFADEAEANDFLENVEADSGAEGQFHVEKVDQDDHVELHFTYRDTASEEGRPIYLYISLDFETEAEAEAYLADQLALYPDLFSEGTLIPLDNDHYDVILKVRPHVDTRLLSYTDEMVQYRGRRHPHSYTLEEGEADVIQQRVNEVFPQAFDFEETTSEEGRQVTMTPTEASGQLDDEEILNPHLTGWQARLQDFLNPYGIAYQHFVIGVAVVIALIGVLIIIIR